MLYCTHLGTRQLHNAESDIMTITLLQGKRIVLGVTGSIACYKSADLASKLTQAGALVDVILTESAQQFVTSLTFRSVTGRPVYTDMWSHEQHVQHIGLGESADLLIISPATAHTIAKLAHGLADNLLTVTALAARCPVLVAPAMDGGMFQHPAVQANLMLLEQRGVTLAGPAEGRMASGLVGPGRLLETPELIGLIRLAFGRDGLLAGKRVLVTTGPTQEPFDPVRYITNRSSGKQGVALAQAALDLGAHVTVIAGPIAEPIPVGAAHVPVQTAMEMHDAVLGRLAAADVLVKVAAVADFRPAIYSEQKIKKTKISAEAPSIQHARNLDLLAALHTRRAATGKALTVLGFAAETEDVINHGRDKMSRKGMDFIAINDVSAANAGFQSADNQVILLGPDGLQVTIPLQSKAKVAEQIMAHLAAYLNSS